MFECKHCGWLREDEPKEAWDTCPNCDNNDWMRQGERNDIKWTATPPTREGWYWAIHEAGNDVTMVQVCKLSDDYLTTDSGPLFFFTHWLGPLPVPSPPQEG